jgi:hypothetical protein
MVGDLSGTTSYYSITTPATSPTRMGGSHGEHDFTLESENWWRL